MLSNTHNVLPPSSWKLVCNTPATHSLCAPLHCAPVLLRAVACHTVTKQQSCAPSGWMLSADALTPTPPGASWTAQGAQLMSSLMMEKPWVLEEMLALASWKNCARPNLSARDAAAGALGSETLDVGALQTRMHGMAICPGGCKHWQALAHAPIAGCSQVRVAATLQSLTLPHLTRGAQPA